MYPTVGKLYLRQLCHEEVKPPIIGNVREHEGPEGNGGPDRFPRNGKRDSVGGRQSSCYVLSLSRGDTKELLCFYSGESITLATWGERKVCQQQK